MGWGEGGHKVALVPRREGEGDWGKGRGEEVKWRGRKGGGKPAGQASGRAV